MVWGYFVSEQPGQRADSRGQGAEKGPHWGPQPRVVLARQGHWLNEGGATGWSEGNRSSTRQFQMAVAKEAVGVFQSPGCSAHSGSLFRHLSQPPGSTAPPCLPRKLLEAQGRRRMDAHMGVYRTPPIKATWEERRVLWIRKLPIWELVTSTEKEPQWLRLCTPPQVKGAYSWWGALASYSCTAGG